MRRKNRVSGFAVLAALALLVGCERPTHDPVQLKAVKAEAQVLLEANPLDGEIIEKPRWPRAIARLKPEFVSTNADGIYITTKPFFDGGWGYFVPRRGQNLPDPVARFEDVGQGVYWFHPE